MNLVYALLPILFMHSIINAQYDNTNKKDSLKIVDAQYSYHTLSAEKNERSAVRLPYDTIMFKDVRYDTTFFAINYPILHISKTYNIKENFSGGFSKNLSNYFNSYFTTGNSNGDKKLICFIKKFSITQQYDFLKQYNNGNLRDNRMNQIYIEIECYYKHGNTLFPAVRFDTSYTHRFPTIINVPAIVKELLQPLVIKIEQANLDRITQRKSYTEAEVFKRYTDRFDIPILTANSYAKGIYKNFNEFKNNSPSIDSFSITADKMKVNATDTKNFDLTSLAYRAFQKNNNAIFLYDKNNQLISPSDVFGFSDGQTIWIQHGAFYYPMEKISNSFEFMYVYHYNDGNDHTNTMYILSPLNMETGKSN
jgi:hypothetical protein